MRYEIKDLGSGIFKLTIFHPKDGVGDKTEEVWVCQGEEELVFRLAAIFYGQAPQASRRSILIGKFQKKDAMDRKQKELSELLKKAVEDAQKQYEDYKDILIPQPAGPLTPSVPNYPVPPNYPTIQPGTAIPMDTWTDNDGTAGGNWNLKNFVTSTFSASNVIKLNLTASSVSTVMPVKMIV